MKNKNKKLGKCELGLTSPPLDNSDISQVFHSSFLLKSEMETLNGRVGKWCYKLYVLKHGDHFKIEELFRDLKK